MQNIHLTRTDNTPEINFNFQTGIFEISGVSYPEYAREFYEPVVESLEKYVENPPTYETKMVFKFTYFNTGTNTLITAILQALEALHQKGHKIDLQWHYEEDDEDMRELGEYFKTLTILPVTFVEVEEI